MKCKLGDVCDITSSKRIFAKEYRSTGIPFFRGKEIIEKQAGKRVSTELFIEKARYKEIAERFGVPKEGDILLTSVGTLGVPYVVGKEEFYFKDGNLTWLKNFKDANSTFIYYWLLSPYGQTQVAQKSIGSTQKALTIETLLSFDIDLPDIDIQCKIAATLRALDDKIAVNTQINHHLEQIAQAIFKLWFMNFEPFADGEFIDSEQGKIPIGWSVQKIENIAEKVAMGPFGSNIKVETFVENGVPIISGNHLRGLYLDELGYNFITEEHACRLSNSLVRAGDIIFTHAGNIGQVALIPDDCDYPYYVISQRQFYLRCDKTKVLPEYINYFFHSREGQGKLLANASQTGVPSIARPSSHLKGIAVILPPIEVQLEWFETVRAMLQTLNSNKKESKRLASIRDSLLPRLMSGELSVAELCDVK
jgi:type I restriction enzyme S subunit